MMNIAVKCIDKFKRNPLFNFIKDLCIREDLFVRNPL